MSQSFFILEITGVIDSRFGNCVALSANPVTENNLGMMNVIPYKNKDTKVFFLPEEDSIIQPLVRLARSQRPWKPNMSDFKEVWIYNEDSRERILIYRHRSFYNEPCGSVVNDGEMATIPFDKSEHLQQSYLNYMRNNFMLDPIDMQEYVSRLADEDPNFFAWLFDDNRLNGCSQYELEEEQLEAWRKFYKSLDLYKDL
jgi:hypothetical protein